MKEKVAVSKRLSENIAQMEEFFHECDDIKKKELMLGRQMDVACYLTFIEVSVDMGTSALSEVLKYLKGLGKEEIYQALEQNALGISDATYFDTIEDAVPESQGEAEKMWYALEYQCLSCFYGGSGVSGTGTGDRAQAGGI